jgi:hypothetical protein
VRAVSDRPGETEEIVLVGSMDPRWAPVRVGDTVRRASDSDGGAVRELLEHLERAGFDGAPRHLGTDEKGREVLSWVDGDVPLPPYPDWAMTDRALADLGALLRRYHDATVGFEPSPALAGDWARDWADPTAGAGSPDRVICHDDLFPENVVFRAGGVVALIDFAMAAPGRRFWDVAIAAEIWAPLGDPARRDQHPPELDGIARFGILARSYGVVPGRAAELVDMVSEQRAQMIGNIHAEIAAGNESWIGNWAAAGGDERAAAGDAWIAAHRDALIRAAGGGAQARARDAATPAGTTRAEPATAEACRRCGSDGPRARPREPESGRSESTESTGSPDWRRSPSRSPSRPCSGSRPRHGPPAHRCDPPAACRSSRCRCRRSTGSSPRTEPAWPTGPLRRRPPRRRG